MASTGRLIIRGVVGGLAIGFGGRKLFGWFGGAGHERTAETFESFGYRNGRVMATLAGVTELAAGVGLVTGTATPLAASALIGEMVNAAAVHRRQGLWAENGGYEYPLVLATAATCLAWDGPGSLSVDRALGRERTGPAWGLGALALGLTTGTAVWRLLRDEQK
ncbi:DoxX family protein [Streptomyces sp. NBC_00455]|uniref:DoxX family protein n=1 Tax=Streptomyces sp. NBC_00455 TaxID=2903654 RepID=UPI002E1AEE53